MRPQSILRALGAGMALGVLAFTALATTGAAGAHPDPARADAGAARPAAGGRVAIARQRLNVVAGGRALVSGRVAAAGAGRAVALQRRGGAGWHTIDRA